MFRRLTTGMVVGIIDVKGFEKGTGGGGSGVPDVCEASCPDVPDVPDDRGILAEGARKLSQDEREALRRRWCLPEREPLKSFTNF